MSRPYGGGGGGPSTNTLDSLMLSYADLSSGKNSQSKGFKGPPVKEIKRETTPSQTKKVYQHSSKSRDWSTLDQSLEDAFGFDSTKSSARPPLIPSNPAIPSNKSDIDEWGDFQDFTNTVVSPLAPPTQSVDPFAMSTLQSKKSPFQSSTFPSPPVPPKTTNPPPQNQGRDTSNTVGCRLASFQENESPVHTAVFKAPSLPPKPLSPPALSIRKGPLAAPPKSPVPNIMDNDEEFGDFTGPTAIQQPQPLNPFAGSASTNVGLGLTMSPMPQSLSPVSLQPPTPFPSAPSQATKSLSPRPGATPSLGILSPSTSSTKVDKYSALRDLLGDSPSDTVSPSEIFPSVTLASLESESELPHPNISPSPSLSFQPSISSTNSSIPSFFDTNSVPINPLLPTQLPVAPLIASSNPFAPIISTKNSNIEDLSDIFSSSKETDDFGDFVESANDVKPKIPSTLPLKPVIDGLQPDFVDEWSLSTEAPPPLPSRSPVFSAPAIPYIACSSPPPLDVSIPANAPGDEKLAVEDFKLPSEQFTFSDHQLFGIKESNERESSVKPATERPKSIFDVINNSKTADEKLLSNSKDDGACNKADSKSIKEDSPESQSVSSLEFVTSHPNQEGIKGFEDKLEPLDKDLVGEDDEWSINLAKEKEEGPIKLESPELDEWSLPAAPISEPDADSEDIPEESPYKEWRLLLLEVCQLLDSTSVTLGNIVSSSVLNEVVSSPGGSSFIMGLGRVMGVVDRLERSLCMRATSEAGYYQVKDILFRVNTSWSSLQSVLGVGEEEPQGEGSLKEEGGICSICLLDKVELEHEGHEYHAACANFWLNCVNHQLPILALKVAS